MDESDRTPSEAVEAEVVNGDGSPLPEPEDPNDPLTDAAWGRSRVNGRKAIRMALQRRAPNWSGVHPSKWPAYVHARNAWETEESKRLGAPGVDPAKMTKAVATKRIVDELVDRIMFIATEGTNDEALKAVKFLLEHADPAMTKNVAVEARGSKIIVLPNEVADQI